jgi:hypothetical protein
VRGGPTTTGDGDDDAGPPRGRSGPAGDGGQLARRADRCGRGQLRWEQRWR